MSKEKALYWPYGIALSFVLIIALIIGTIIVAGNNKVEDSDNYMSNYHYVDKNYNEIIKAEIAFNSSYNLEYERQVLKEEGCDVVFTLRDKAGQPVNDAKMKIVVTRPNTHEFNKELNAPKIENGQYRFEGITLEKPGRWNILAHVQVNDDYRYCEIKTGTRMQDQLNVSCIREN